MPVSIQLLNINAATHQCTQGANGAAVGPMSAHFAGTTAFALRAPGGVQQRVELGQYTTGTNVPNLSAVVQLRINDGVEHAQILTFCRDVETWIRANNPSTDQMDAQMMIRGWRTIIDYVRQNTIRS